MMKKVLIIVCVLQSIFTSAQAASLRGSGSFLSNEDDNYGQCIAGCNDLDTDERKICQAGCDDKYPHEAYGACLSRCARLRIAPGHCTCDPPEEPTKEPLEDSSSGDTDRTAEDYESCIVSCSEDYDTESSEFGQCRTKCNEAYADDITPCQSRCWRLRLTRDGQVDCIVDCSADDEPDTDTDGVSNRSADDESDESCGACTSRCAKLRIAPGFCKCSQCPSGPSEDVTMDVTPPPYEEGETPPPYEDGTQPPAPVPVDNPCKRRCDMLKIAPGPSMNACLDKCPTDDFYVRVS